MAVETPLPEIKVIEPKITTRIALIVEYDGTNYFGSQFQSDQPTIQSELEKALEKLTGEHIRIGMASRTDTGVHARGQVVSFKTTSTIPLEAFVHGLNHHLPDDISVHSAYKTALSFDARRTAINREYSYTLTSSKTRSPLTARFTHRITGKLDIGAMNKACRSIIGTHDFASFASDIGDEPEMNTVRNVEQADVSSNGELIVFTMVANAFLRHQVRNTGGALVQVGLGKMSESEFNRRLELKTPGIAGPALPPCGLCLVRVNYPLAIEEMR
jgi:tRNA pseudouridine38-40 synthase